MINWKGTPLDECSREELYDCVEYLSIFHRKYFLPENISMRAKQKVKEFKFGETSTTN